jgi:hypothetical protein
MVPFIEVPKATEAYAIFAVHCRDSIGNESLPHRKGGVSEAILYYFDLALPSTNFDES